MSSLLYWWSVKSSDLKYAKILLKNDDKETSTRSFEEMVALPQSRFITNASLNICRSPQKQRHFYVLKQIKTTFPENT